MKLVASLLVHNELGRYLTESLGHLLEFCDEIAILDSGSADGTFEWLAEHPGRDRLQVLRTPFNGFFEHEGRTRQQLLEWTLASEPTHILAIDADEFVSDGYKLRGQLGTGVPVWTLEMEEVWELDGDCICVRHDGGWHPHPVPIVYTVPPPARRDGVWAINDRALACGREPIAVRRAMAAARPSGVSVLHFGWANEAERQARYERYAVADGGRFHASTHLQSILWPAERIHLEGRPWPSGLASRREELTRLVARGRSAP